MLLYKFKSSRSILEQYHELENQTIHFSSRENLNDPLEGYINLFWQGDIIAWKGLFKNYVSCLESVFSMYRLDARKQQLHTIPIFLVESMLPTESYKKLINNITTEFINLSLVDSIISTLGKENFTVNRNDIRFFLSLIHVESLKIIMKHHCLNGLMGELDCKDINILPNHEDIEKLLDAYTKTQNEETNIKDIIFKTINSMLEEITLDGKVLLDISSNDERRMDWYYILFEFPKAYLQQIENLIHPPCYMACFSKNFFNSSMWGNYADNHKGICLIFSTSDVNDDYFIQIERPHSLDNNGVHKSYNKAKLEKVLYGDEYSDINFFEMLGRLNGIQMSYWFMDGNKKSQVLDKIESGKDKWRQKYWEIFNKRYYTKTEEWSFEEEYRIRIESSIIESYELNESRNLKYQFDSLEGIIFGIETSEIDKARILEIISEKCIESKRKDFKVYQAYFDEETKTIKSSELKIIERNVIEGKYVKKEDLRRKLNHKVLKALNKLYENDEYLIRNNQSGNLKNHVGERAIIFRLGIYLEELLRGDSEFAKYNLDNEYNRNIGQVKQLPEHENGVYPDLALHKRGNNDDNILVIDIKTWWNQDISTDKDKLHAFTDMAGIHKYKFGLSITIEKYNPKIIWFENGIEIVPK
ncbi:MAG: DUF2971 domain-containing protein [Mobilitalea sp.]